MSISVVPSDIHLTLRVSPDARFGDSVPLALAVENRGREPVDLYLRGRNPAFDILIEDENGALVWQRLAGEIIPAIVQVKTLSPGESLVFRARWDQRTHAGAPVGPGEYRIRGLLLTDGESLRTEPLRLTISH